jgi:hypothetical protein
MPLSLRVPKALSIALLILSVTAAASSQSKGIDPALLAKAKAGDADAEQRVSLIYSRLGNQKESCRWGLMAAQHGNVDAQFILGEFYENGSTFCGLPKDYAQAAVWLRKAAEQGDVLAQDELAFLYYNGQDYAQAAIWWRKAAEQGTADAQYALACAYAKGNGVPQDYKEAARWAQKSAELGNAAAQHSIGFAYDVGEGVLQDHTQAAYWYRKAAEQGDASSQYSLGLLYYGGQGVPQDYAESYFWFDLAASGKLESIEPQKVASLRDAAASNLTKTVLLQTQERARKWFEEHSAKAIPQ